MIRQVQGIKEAMEGWGIVFIKGLAVAKLDECSEFEMFTEIVVDSIEWPNRNVETIVWWMELLTE